MLRGPRSASAPAPAASTAPPAKTTRLFQLLFKALPDALLGAIKTFYDIAADICRLSAALFNGYFSMVCSWRSGDEMRKAILAAVIAGAGLAPAPVLADAREDVVNGM